jgi:rhamnosyltransferase
MVGVVILYHPDTVALIENIKTYINPLDTLLVYDNSETLTKELEIAVCAISNKVIFKHFGQNEGIAKRLNQAIEYAVQKGEKHLLMMDQDSSFQDGDLHKYAEYINNISLPNVAQFGVNCQLDFTPISSNPEKVISLITSGSVLAIDCIQQIGMFDENLFIDFVDTDFSHRVTNKGYVNLQFTNIVLNHSIGTKVEGRSLVTFKKSLRIIHSPIRVYYIIRNGLYLFFSNKELANIQKKDIKRTLMVVKNDFIYNPQLFKVYKYALLGVWDFLTKKMGKKQ